MILSILDYSSGTLQVIDVPNKYAGDIEDYLFDILEYSESDINWMETKLLDINISQNYLQEGT